MKPTVSEKGPRSATEDVQVPPGDEHAGRNKHRLKDNILSLYALLGLYYIIPLAVLPYLVRVLGIERYGLVAFSQSFAQYFTTLTDYGFNFSATRAIAQKHDDSEAVSSIFCAVYGIKLTLALLGAVILELIVLLVPRFHTEGSFFWVAYIGVVGNVLFPTWYFQGIERMRYISTIVGVTRIIAGIMVFVLVHRPADALLAVGVQSGGTVLGGLIGVFMAVRTFDLKFRVPKRSEIQQMLVEGWHLFVSSAAIGLYTNTNVFLVGALAGNVEAGFFAAAERLLRGLQALIVPVIQATYPHVSKLRAESEERALVFVRRSFRWICGLTCIPSLGMLFLAGPIALLCFGPGAYGSVSVLRWVAFLPVLSAVSNVLGINTMIPFGMDKQFSRIVIAAGVGNVIVACILIPHFGANGAGASILFAEAVVVSGIFLALEKKGIRLFSATGAV